MTDGRCRIQTWLEQPSALHLLRSIGRSIVGKSSRIGAAGGNWDLEEVDEVVSELSIFLLEKAAVFETLVSVDDPHFGAYLRHAFSNHLKSRQRSKSRDPYRYLYKRAGDVLRRDPRFDLRGGKSGGSTFSAAGTNASAVLLASEDLAEIPFPLEICDRLTEEAISRSGILAGLATRMLDEVGRMCGRTDIRLSLRDFVGWIGLHVPLGAFRTDADTRLALEFAHPGGVPSQPSGMAPKEADISGWAGRFAARLSHREALAFYLRHGAGLGLADVAGQIGYKGASGASYLIGAVENRLRGYLRDLPELSPDDLDEGAFAIFMESLLEVLKNAAVKPLTK